jgi:hypothetical protein
MKFAIASVQGSAHRKAQPEVPKQDSGICFLLENDYQVGIISDGAGSSKYSHIASEFCITCLKEIITRDFIKIDTLETLENADVEWAVLSKSWFKQVRDGLVDSITHKGGDLSDYNCTLLLVIKTKQRFFACNVGDGRSGGAQATGAFSIIVPFMTFTVGATSFITKDEWSVVFRSYVIESTECDFFFLSSDGPQGYIIDHQAPKTDNRVYDDLLPGEIYYDSNLPFTPFFIGLIESLNEVNDQNERDIRLKDLIEFGIYQKDGQEQILSSLIKPELDDDKTLIVFFN